MLDFLIRLCPSPIFFSLIVFLFLVGCWILFFRARKRWGMSYVLTVVAVTVGLFIYEVISIFLCNTHNNLMFSCLGAGFFEMHLLISGAFNPIFPMDAPDPSGGMIFFFELFLSYFSTAIIISLILFQLDRKSVV